MALAALLLLPLAVDFLVRVDIAVALSVARLAIAIALCNNLIVARDSGRRRR